MSETQVPVGDSQPSRQVKRHLLKSWPEYFEKLIDGTKTFEIRKNDRDFQVGDELEIYLWDNGCLGPKGQPSVVRLVNYIMYGPAFGLNAGWCIMSLIRPVPSVSHDSTAPERKQNQAGRSPTDTR